MNLLFYSILFLLGISVGAYWSIKVSEIPENLDMKRTHYSNHPKEELLSKLTYMIIGGGTLVILANILRIDLHKIDLGKMIIYIFAVLYVSSLMVVAGIDKNYSKIEKSVLAFGIITSITYMIYLFMVDLTSIYMSGIYLIIYMILLIIDTFLLRKYAKDSYIIDALLLLTIILVFTNLKLLIYTLIMALTAIIVYILIQVKQKKKKGNKKLKINEIPVGYFIAASNIIVLLMIRIFESYYI